ncbi:uncharacterized protein V6R79_014187 [Siganus canaliculatus]
MWTLNIPLHGEDAADKTTRKQQENNKKTTRKQQENNKKNNKKTTALSNNKSPDDARLEKGFNVYVWKETGTRGEAERIKV